MAASVLKIEFTEVKFPRTAHQLHFISESTSNRCHTAYDYSIFREEKGKGSRERQEGFAGKQCFPRFKIASLRAVSGENDKTMRRMSLNFGEES